MTAARRRRYNFSLQHAAALARQLQRPLVVLEALRCDYPWASDRLHQFVLDGMRANARAFAGTDVRYFPYVEPERHGGDPWPAAPKREARWRARAPCGAGDTGVRDCDRLVSRVLPSTHECRRRGTGARAARGGRREHADPGRRPRARVPDRARISRVRPARAARPPRAIPARRSSDGAGIPAATAMPPAITRRWPPTNLQDLDLPALPIDHAVRPVMLEAGTTLPPAPPPPLRLPPAPAVFGGSQPPRRGRDESPVALPALRPHLAARGLLGRHDPRAVDHAPAREPRRRRARRMVERVAVGGELSRSARRVARARVQRQRMDRRVRAVRHPPVVGTRDPRGAPRDPRPHLYDLDTLEGARTDDEVWNAAQRQLVSDGWFHGYMRMLWGKKILEWSPDPATALAHMEHLMNRYSLDGRDPVSYANFGWVLGRYDRPWPEHAVFGTVRCMTSRARNESCGCASICASTARRRGLAADCRWDARQPLSRWPGTFSTRETEKTENDFLLR